MDDRGDWWQALGRSVIGTLHVTHGIANQDALAVLSSERSPGSVVLALADGHGAPMHYRSGTGAHMAVAAAVEVLDAALADPEWMHRADARAVREAGADIIAHWRRQALAHLAKDPPRPGRADGPGLPALTPYGTTLIAAVATPEGACVLQLGDGDLLVGCRDGTIRRPMQDDAGMIGEETHSLCQEDAARHLRVAVLRGPGAEIDFLMLATDGVAKSFPDERHFMDLAVTWRRLIAEQGLPAIGHGLGGWLTRTSRQGSGDDMTLAFAVRGLGPGPGQARGEPLAETDLPQIPTGRRTSMARTRPRTGILGRRLLTAIVSAAGAAAIAVAAYLIVAP